MVGRGDEERQPPGRSVEPRPAAVDACWIVAFRPTLELGVQRRADEDRECHQVETQQDRRRA
jgi:hypothetical protein